MQPVEACQEKEEGEMKRRITITVLSATGGWELPITMWLKPYSKQKDKNKRYKNRRRRLEGRESMNPLNYASLEASKRLVDAGKLLYRLMPLLVVAPRKPDPYC
jgi:DNA polymerase III delta prime subunit